MREAAAMPLIFITAWEGLVDRADVQAGQTVLVQGGAGGVGHMAIQVARARGARVYATDRAERADYLATLGATPIDRDISVEDYVALHTGGQGFDLVYDTVGGPVLDASFHAVKRFGHVVSALGWGTHALAPLSFRAATYSGVFTLLPILTGEGRAHHGAILGEAARLADAGLLTPRLDDHRYTLETVAAAHEAITNRSALGKLVVDIIR
jgi:NADPH:quinone reductase-like Zn-dependent oxidoreductase